MIDQEETEYSIATESRNLLGQQLDGDLEGTCIAGIQGRLQSSDHITPSVGERWKTSMAHVCIPAPRTATLIFRSAWCAPDRSCVRPLRAYRPG
jgi:hypothetical protein